MNVSFVNAFTMRLIPTSDAERALLQLWENKEVFNGGIAYEWGERGLGVKWLQIEIKPSDDAQIPQAAKGAE